MNLNKRDSPLVSVIMAAYNCSQFVDESINSIMNQTYSNIELIIVDDNSTDNTRVILEKWKKTYPQINLIFNSKNTGPANARNIAIRMASGKYLAIMDADDISMPERIEKQVNFMEENAEIGVLGTECRILHKNVIIKPKFNHDKIKIAFLFGNQLSHPSIMIRASLLKNLNFLYNESFVPAEDYYLWINLINSTLFANINEELVFYRLHGDNISKTMKNSIIENSINSVHWRNFDNNITDFTRLNLNKLMRRQYLDLTIKKKFFLLHEICRLIELNKRNRYFNNRYFEVLMINLISILIKKTGKVAVLKLCLRKRIIFFYWLKTIIIANDEFDFYQCEWRKEVS